MTNDVFVVLLQWIYQKSWHRYDCSRGVVPVDIYSSLCCISAGFSCICISFP